MPLPSEYVIEDSAPAEEEILEPSEEIESEDTD